jgi:hypothetical protein
MCIVQIVIIERGFLAQQSVQGAKSKKEGSIADKSMVL